MSHKMEQSGSDTPRKDSFVIPGIDFDKYSFWNRCVVQNSHVVVFI